MNRILISSVALAMLLCVGLAWAINQPRPLPGTIHSAEGPASVGQTWTLAVRDTSVNDTLSLVTRRAFTQMTGADSIVLYSSNSADSTYIRVIGINNADTSRAEVVVRIKGTDSTYTSTRFRYIEGAYSDTSSAGTLSIRAKTGTSVILAIPAGEIQTEVANHFFGQRGGGLREMLVQADPESPTIQLQLRLYRLHRTGLARPWLGYSVLWEGFVGGSASYHTQDSTAIVSTNDDTSRIFSLVGAERIGYFASFTGSNGTRIVASYMDVSADTISWHQSYAVDSINLTGSSGVNVRAKPIYIDSTRGQPYGRIVLNGKAVAADTAWAHVWITVNRGSETASQPIIVPMDEECPRDSYLAVYARSLGIVGRVFVRLKGYDL